MKIPDHESHGSETLALNYHILWAIICIFCAANFCQAAVLCYPIASSYGGQIGLVFKQNYWSCVAQVILSFFALLWHVYGAWIHVGARRRLQEKVSSCGSNT